MGLMDGISRGLSAAGYAGGEMYARGALQDQQAAIQLERDKRLAELQEQSAIRGEQRGMANRTTERGLIFNETVDRAPTMRDIKVQDTKAAERAKLDPEILALQNKAKTEALTAEEQGKLDFYEKNKDSIISRKRAEAAATRDPSLDKLHGLQAQSAQLDLDYKKQETRLPPAVKARGDSIRDEIKTISGSISKAQAEGLFDINSDNAKSLMGRYQKLTGELDGLLSPYYGNKKPKSEEATQPSKGPATLDNITAYAKRANMTLQQAMEEAKNAGYDVSGITIPEDKPNGLVNTPDFNEAGYSDVQSTIDGAKRGDEKAKAMLPKLISRGQTSQTQRKQIDAILKQ